MNYLLSLLIFLITVTGLCAQDARFPLVLSVERVNAVMSGSLLVLSNGKYCISKENLAGLVQPGTEVTLDGLPTGEFFLLLPNDDTKHILAQYSGAARGYGAGPTDEERRRKEDAEKLELQRQVQQEEAAVAGGNGINILNVERVVLKSTGAGIYNYGLSHKLVEFETEKIRAGARKRFREDQPTYTSTVEQLTSLGNGDLDEEEAAAMEQALINQMAGLAGQSSKPFMEAMFKPGQLASYTWEGVQRALPAGAAGVEFVKVRFYEDEWVNEYHYYAAVIHKGMAEPELVYLGESGWVEEQFGTLTDRNGAKFYARGTKDPDNSVAAQLYNFCWRPLEQHLRGISEVYFSPAGALVQVSFGALNGPDGQPLMLSRRLHQLGSTRDLIDGLVLVESLPPTSSCWLLAGGIDYEHPPLEVAIPQTPVCETSFGPPREDNRFENSTLQFEPLPSTLTEVKTIGADLDKRSINHLVVTGQEASVEVFSTLGDGNVSPGVIHAATHGYSFRSKEETSLKTATRSLGRSGIILAGGDAWNAEALIEQDLSGTELVVLSACNSGRGVNVLREGVFGMQRGLKLAGARNLMVSQWPVDDEAGALFMTSFYENWLSGISVHEAFTRTRKMMINHPKYSSPYYWAVFQLIE